MLPVLRYLALLMALQLTTRFATSTKDDFVLVLTSYPGFEARVAAGRASRQGLRTIIITNELRPETADLRKFENETWVEHKGSRLEAIAPFAAFKELGETFKWILVGEDDTLFFRAGARTAVQGMNENEPHFISDAAWFISHEGKRHYLKIEAPRCVPCNYPRDMTELPKHFVKECPCSVTGDPPGGSCGPHKMPSMDYFENGGAGYLLSVGLLKKVPLQHMQTCLSQGDPKTDLATCLWKLGIGITDPDPVWHPEGMTFFDPTPSPYLTHENIMEKSSYSLGKLLRMATGMCTDICKDEVIHMVSLHLNAARIGYTRSGEKRIGDYKDPGQREFVGQVLMRAISRFYSQHVAQNPEPGTGHSNHHDVSEDGQELAGTADLRLSAAKELIQGMTTFFKDDVLADEGQVRKPIESTAATRVSTMERARSAVAMAVARQALDLIIQDATGGTVV